MLFLSYELAFKRTLESWQTHKQLQTRIAQASDLNYQPAYLERKNSNLDNIINLYKTDTAIFRSNIINTISMMAENENVKLSEVPVQDPLFSTNKLIIQKLNFEGDFFSLTKVLNRLQASKNTGFIRSLNYKAVEIRTNSGEKKKLILEVYLEITK